MSHFLFPPDVRFGVWTVQARADCKHAGHKSWLLWRTKAWSTWQQRRHVWHGNKNIDSILEVLCRVVDSTVEQLNAFAKIENNDKIHIELKVSSCHTSLHRSVPVPATRRWAGVQSKAQPNSSSPLPSSLLTMAMDEHTSWSASFKFTLDIQNLIHLEMFG